MIITTTETCGCRGCGRVIGRNSRVSWVDGEGPYHIECTHLAEDVLAEHNRLTESPATKRPTTTSTQPDSVTYAATALSCLMLLAALFGDFPYGYYQFLRWIVCSTLILLAFRVYSQKKELLTWGLGLLAFTYNPISPVHYSRGIWSIVNITTIALLLVALVAYHRSRKRV